MRLAVSSYSFGDLVKSDKLGFFGIMDEAVRMGFEGLELHGTDDIMNADMLSKIGKYSREIGLPIIAVDVGADFTKNDLTSLDEEVDRVKKLLEITSVLDTQLLRHDVSYGNFTRDDITFDDAVSVMAEGCMRVADYAQSLGITTMVENHGFYMQSPNKLGRLLTTVNHGNFGMLIDVGNFMCDDLDPVKSTRDLVPFVVHVHAKDFHFKNGTEPDPGCGWFKNSRGNYLRGAIIGHGDARTYESIKILRDEGYEGYVTLEFEGIEDNLKGIELGLDNLRKYI